MELKIKKFKELNIEELYQILKARNEVFIVEQECPYLDCDDKDKNSYHMFFMEDDKLASYVRILGKGISFEQVSIGRVLVNKDYRGSGIARKIMIEAIKFIENNMNEKEIKISAQEYLKDFYKGLGFKEVSEVYLEDEIPHRDMIYIK
ncbi:GNAT family N-acetyltransferase [Clostridium frigidicarnis]|uniref:ElaA protein n=1 Tax=Clostridium frigidicarnis TaxID=84698 RepID=A0A1I0ZU06_9CLOT|nr:GNAT family N-acetyltransferase [Clostridium frigidicarnis]SFB29184.1 ElaA protein [Clostridium frigidicarnis]